MNSTNLVVETGRTFIWIPESNPQVTFLHETIEELEPVQTIEAAGAWFVAVTSYSKETSFGDSQAVSPWDERIGLQSDRIWKDLVIFAMAVHAGRSWKFNLSMANPSETEIAVGIAATARFS